MKLTQKLAQRLLFCVAPVVTGSVFIALPGFAASTAISGSQVELSNFSHKPTETSTFTDTKTFTNTDLSGIYPASDSPPPFGIAAASADALAIFPPASSALNTQAFNNTLSTAQGDGIGYLGVSQSYAQVTGHSFTIGAGETFSFDAKAFLGVETSTSNKYENASAFGNISFLLFDSSDMKNPLDFFSISAQVGNDGEDFLKISKSADLNFEPTNVALDASVGKSEENIFAFFEGTFSRFFDKLTNLTFVEFKNNSAGVSCPLS
jgi:hypothetical protein